MLTNILGFIAFAIISFDVFMITPFGVLWTLKNLENNQYCYGIIIMCVTVVPLMFILYLLGLL